MANPVWLDGPLEGQEHLVPDELVEQGMYRAGPEPDSIYTFTRVQFLGKVVTVASTAGRIPPHDVLFGALASAAARRAAE